MMFTNLPHRHQVARRPRQASAYADLTLRQAALVAVAFVAFLAVSIWVTCSPFRYVSLADTPPHPSGLSDMDLYWEEARAIHAGEDYYEVAARELASRGYATQSVFNWRLPLPMWLFGALYNHREVGAGILAVLLAIALLTSFEAIRRDGTNWQAIGCILLLLGVFLPVLYGDNYILAEAWAAPLMTISASCLIMSKPIPGVVTGISAGFFRELAIGYSLVMVTLALWKRSWKEAAGWLLGLLLFGGFYIWHIGRVTQYVQTGTVDASPWLHLGGLGFVLVTVQMNAWLFEMPQWISAIYLSVGLLGLGSWTSWNGCRVSVATLAYLTLFFVAGYAFNQYWGLLTAPLLCFGVARAPAAFTDLCNNLMHSPRSPETLPTT